MILQDYIADIRKTYTKDFSSSDPTRKQIAVATYLIDRLALRAGNEKVNPYSFFWFLLGTSSLRGLSYFKTGGFAQKSPKPDIAYFVAEDLARNKMNIR